MKTLSFWIITISCAFLAIFWLLPKTYADSRDLLKKSYEQVFNYDYATDKEATDLFEWGVQIGGWWAWNYDSIVVRFGRFMIRLTIVLALPVLMYVGIGIIMAWGDDGKVKTLLKQGGYVLAGILLALLCVMIVYFITAFFRTNQNFI